METSLPSLSILVAEDNTIVNDILVKMLRRMGFDPDTVEDGEAALQAVKSKNYDVLFMDLKMPVMNGLEATRRIQTEVPSEKRPVIIGHSNYSKELQNAIKAGMRGFIPKPCSYDVLLNVMSVFAPSLGDATTPVIVAHTKNHTDFTALYEMTGGDRNFLSDILQMILARLPGDMKAIASCIENKDWEGLRKAAHKVKTSAAYAGAEKLLSLLQELEHGAMIEAPIEELSELYREALTNSHYVIQDLQLESSGMVDVEGK